ncbi:PP2C family protein-serine/threonine phosphatase [Aeromicrobium fastidiosum]|uniref:Serine/threonine-protein phosphatase n=1 Tax=Aeromicrobium fastidiosum TaxID=52699 RepID=A0A641ALU4_9ACTN|nr:protein phosphatase 2C domain-containing protein [Aeromicrobium fastidiosum]KAA1374691.1 serine/threonine-protein phosphatase [Aeromicrobium fastidiosum]MBP2390763.1 protein phosphatase [Aeromicrobium fastidiosum]
MSPEPTACLSWTPSGGDALAVRAAAGTHVGLVRGHNEDAWSIDPPVFVVADGMGGHDAGDVASHLVIEAFRELAGTTHVAMADMDRCVRSAKSLVDALSPGERGAPGSTLVAAGYTRQDDVPFWLIANVGDSRAYSWRAGVLEQVSRDHSVVQELIEAGEIDDAEARHHPDRHVITRAIGALEDAVAEFAMIPLLPGARLLLCSDGLSSEIDDDQISRVLASVPSPDDAVEALIAAALAAGGRDNVTALLIDAVGVQAVDETTLTGGTRLDEDTLRSAL